MQLKCQYNVICLRKHLREIDVLTFWFICYPVLLSVTHIELHMVDNRNTKHHQTVVTRSQCNITYATPAVDLQTLSKQLHYWEFGQWVNDCSRKW